MFPPPPLRAPATAHLRLSRARRLRALAEAANQAVNQMAQNMQNAGENPSASRRGPSDDAYLSHRNRVFTRSAALSRCR